jgi:RNA polymerase sigma factor (sigma-70 family)
MDLEQRNQLVLDNMALVATTVRNANGVDALEGAAYERRDVVQEAFVVLIELANRYDTSKAKFPTFYMTRIRGLVKDIQRKADYATRSQRKKINRGELPEPGYEVVSFEGLENTLIDNGEAFKAYENHDLVTKLLSATNLYPRERFVVQKYFLEGHTMNEIAALMGITKSRVSQVWIKARKKLKFMGSLKFATPTP